MGMRKKKSLGGREYVVYGSTIEYEKGRVVYKSYTTTQGKVVIENGIVEHPDGTKTEEK